MVTATLLHAMQGTWQYEAVSRELYFIPKYFRAGIDDELVLLPPISPELENPCIHDITITDSQYTAELNLYWNRTALLLKVSNVLCHMTACSRKQLLKGKV